MFQGKKFKILATSALVVALSHCQGASGKRVFGNQLTTLPNQTQGASTARPQFGQQLLSAMFPSQKNATLPAEAKAFDSTTPDWTKLCADIEKDDVEKKNPLPDTDRDGLSDKCEETLYAKGDFQYSALDPYVFNGLLISGRYFDIRDSKVRIDGDERKKFSEAKSYLNVKGFGTITSATRPLIQKISSITTDPKQPVIAFSEFFEKHSVGAVGVEDKLLSYKRSSDLFKNVQGDEYIALARGDGTEGFSYAPKDLSSSVYKLTGLVPSPSQNSVMETMEFHTIFPSGVDQKMDITIGSPSGNRIMTPSDSFYFVMNDGALFPASGSDSTAKSFTTIYPSAGCETAHVVINHFTDATTILSKKSESSAEKVWYRLNANDAWKPFSQGMLTTQPMGGNACDAKFNYSDPQHTNMFFKIPTALTSRVRGINDFNTSLGDPTTPNSALKVSLNKSDSGSLVDIFGGALGKGNLAGQVTPVKEMDAAHIGQLEKNMAIAFARGLTPEEKPLYEEVMQAIANRKAALAAPVAKVQTDPKIIQLSENGTITLDYATMTCLSKLGFAFADEQGNVYLPKEGETKKISQEVLDQILTQIGKMLDEDKITPEQVDCLLTWLTSDSMKNNPSVIKFMSDYGDKLNGLKPGEEMIRYLRKLNKDLGLGVDQAIDEFAKNDPATKAAAKKTIYDAIEKKLLDPSLASQTTLPFKDRFDIAKNLLSKKFLTDDEYAALVMKIAALKYARDFEVRKDGNLQLRRSTITFNPGTNKLKGEEAESTLAYIADAIQRFKTDAQIKDVRVQVVAHTDNTPTKESAKKRMPKNEALSKGRAQAVADFLSGKTGTQPASYAKGIVSSAKPYEFETPLEPELVIQSDHIESVGMGETQPIASNKTEAGRNKNRRVEVIILKSSK